MLPQIKQFPLISILLLLGCAAQGPATGGPVDKKGPIIISIQPQMDLWILLLIRKSL